MITYTFCIEDELDKRICKPKITVHITSEQSTSFFCCHVWLKIKILLIFFIHFLQSSLGEFSFRSYSSRMVYHKDLVFFKLSFTMFFFFIICNLCQSSPFLTMLLYGLFFYLKLLFSFKGNILFCFFFCLFCFKAL